LTVPETSIERRTRAWRRDNRLRILGYKDYAAYINSPEWKAKRAQFWGDPDIAKGCAVCGGEASVLHHKTYERVGEEALDDLAPLCDPCHRLVHDLERRGDLGLDFDGLVDLARAAKLRRGQRAPESRASQVLNRLEEQLPRIESKARRGKQAAERAARAKKRLEALHE
jgi:hypothetical protein